MDNPIITRLKRLYHSKKVLVVGLGLQGGGLGVTKFFCELGAKVTVTDIKRQDQLSLSLKQLNQLPIRFCLGGHRLDDFLSADVIFKGPSVPWNLPEIIEAQKKNIPIEMELSFFTQYCPGKIIGVTGTRGKSTTTNLIFEILKQSGFSVYLAGNLPGISTINLLKKVTHNDWVVIELSSWALSGFHRKKLSPHIAVFTNFYADHLNYYQNMDDYLYDKKAIYLYQRPQDYLVINKSLLSYIKNGECRSKIIAYEANDFLGNFQYLQGEHNRENAAAAFFVAKILNLDKEKVINIISNFKGLPYRQQIIGKKNNIIFVNDSTSTTPVATVKAIESFSTKKIILILGGNSKNLPFADLIKQLDKVEKIVLLKGSFTDQILDILKVKHEKKISNKVHNRLKEALKEAYQFAAKEKDIHKTLVILFSPGATSFAMFENEFHRGEEFNRIVKNLIHTN